MFLIREAAKRSLQMFGNAMLAFHCRCWSMSKHFQESKPGSLGLVFLSQVFQHLRRFLPCLNERLGTQVGFRAEEWHL